MDKDKVCVHPWSHIAINPNGDVWPCCHQRWPHTYTLGNMHEKTIEQIFNDKPLRKLRKRMLAGELPNDVCNKCVEYEKLNVMSPRQIANKETYAEDVFKLMEKTKPNGSIENYNIKYWDLRWSNKCNMACIMCDPDWSSLWTQQIRTQLKDIDPYIISRHTFLDDLNRQAKQAETKVMSVPNNGWIDKHISEVEYIYFAGGEPLIMDEHWYILDKLHKLGRHNVKLKYNTNMSKLEHLGKNAIDYWKHWDRQKLSVEGSIDETGTRAEYIRYGTVWDIVEKNIKMVADANIKTQPNTSIGCYNIMRLPELLEELWELYQQPNQINLNPVFNVWCRINTLPDDWKQEVKTKLEKIRDRGTIKITRLEKIIDELDRPHNPEQVRFLFKRLSFLDMNKKITVLEAIPEISQLNDRYGGMYEKFRNEWIEKSTNPRFDSAYTYIPSSVHN